MSPIIDFVGYETLIDSLIENRLYELDGDLIEVGAFVGGGTVKLAKFADKYSKKVFVIDVFDPVADHTATTDGTKMSDIYLAFLEGSSQFHAYSENTGSFKNITTIRKDSREVTFPQKQKFMFGFIDGNHRPEYVRSDFQLVWKHLVPNGVVGLHDYKSELPEVTRTIDELLNEKQGEIAGIQEISEKHIVLVTRK